MERNVLYVIIVLLALYGGLYLFNHINAWIGIIAIIIVAFIVIKKIINYLKTKNYEK